MGEQVGAVNLPDIYGELVEDQNPLEWRLADRVKLALDLLNVGLSSSGSGSLVNWTEALNIAAPNAVIPVVSFTPFNAVAANVDAAIVPKGNGALVGDIADNLATGGNKRGRYAVDWQLSRAVATEVASGNYSVIGGGYRNEASATYSFVGGGEFNKVTLNTYNAVVGGYNNGCNNSYGFVGGGESNAITGSHGVIGGGLGNQIGSSFCFIGGGVNNTCNRSSAISGGIGNTSDYSSSIGGGSSNVSIGDFGCIPGGQYADTRSVWGKYAHSAITFSGNFSDAQRGALVLGLATTNATISTMVSSVVGSLGLLPTPVNILVLQNNQAMAVRGQVICRRSVSQADECSVWEFTGAIRRGVNAASTALVAAITPTLIAQDAGLAATVLTITADTTNGGLKVQGTGIAAFNLRWVCTLTTTEVIYA